MSNSRQHKTQESEKTNMCVQSFRIGCVIHIRHRVRCILVNYYNFLYINTVEPSGVQALKNPNPLKDVEALVVLAVAVLV